MVYGKINIAKNGNILVCCFQQHPDPIGYTQYMNNNEFHVTYSNIGYGIYPSKFYITNGKAYTVEIKSNEFVESDAYLIEKNPHGLMVR